MHKAHSLLDVCDAMNYITRPHFTIFNEKDIHLMLIIKRCKVINVLTSINSHRETP